MSGVGEPDGIAEKLGRRRLRGKAAPGGRRGMIQEKKYRNVMGHFPTGVTIVTSRTGDGAPVGLTVSALVSVSLEPILLLVCIHKEAASHGPILRRGSFSVNVLSSEQATLAWRFATEEPKERFEGLDIDASPLGNPLLPGSLAWLDCRVTDVFPGGDHSVILASVVGCEARDGDPLLFHRGVLRGMGA
jgi:flavin reductase (DIM6/NTAB) family NADH-FMN oxidoreductase RutF